MAKKKEDKKNKNIIKEDEKSNLIDIDNVLEGLKHKTNVMEEAYKKLVEILFSEEKLLMIARLKGDMAQNILKNLIVADFYQDFYGTLEVNINFEKINKPPYFRKILNYPQLNYKGELLKKYNKLIDDLMKISISDKGEGRKEILEILKKGSEEIEKEKQFRNFLNPMR